MRVFYALIGVALMFSSIPVQGWPGWVILCSGLFTSMTSAVLR